MRQKSWAKTYKENSDIKEKHSTIINLQDPFSSRHLQKLDLIVIYIQNYTGQKMVFHFSKSITKYFNTF